MDASQAPQTPPDSGAWPAVSVIMPVRNEQDHLGEAVEHVLAQDYAGELELILAVGPSDDDTAAIAAELAIADSRIRVVDNPEGVTPVALNRAIAAASAPYVVRVDGHGALAPGYLSIAVQTLVATGAANVGGVMAAEGRTSFEQAVARGYTSPLGLGGGRFHVGGQAGPATSVFLGAFPRDVLVNHGGYDERFHRAQDWELNLRIRAAGGVVWFEPRMSVTYRPRASVKALARQFFKTGQWRRDLIRQYPQTASLRYLAPPLTLGAVLVGTLLGLIGLVGPNWALLGWLAPLLYLVGLLVGAATQSGGMSWHARVWLPGVLAIMHACWGAGFLLSPRRITGSRPPARWNVGDIPDLGPDVGTTP